MKRIYLFIVGFIYLVLIPEANACTRIVYTGDNGMVVTRSYNGLENRNA